MLRMNGSGIATRCPRRCPPPPIPPRDGGAKHNARVEISRESTHTQASTPVVTCDHFTTVCLVRCYFFKSLAGTLGVMLLEYYG